jgi:hypothetical protein
MSGHSSLSRNEAGLIWDGEPDRLGGFERAILQYSAACQGSIESITSREQLSDRFEFIRIGDGED